MSKRQDNTSHNFTYVGTAVGLSGRLTLPCCEDIETQAGAVVPPTGGRSVSRSSLFNHRGLFSFDSASSLAIAGYDPEHEEHNTLVTSTIRGLNVLDMVTADVVTARIAAVYRGKPGDSRARPQITPLGSHFVNLRIAGRLVDPQLPTRAEYAGGEMPAGARKVHELLAALAAGKAGRERVRTTLSQDEEARKGPIEIPHFGRIFIAEWLDDEYAPRLTMLRISLGCAVEGEMAFGSVEGGGEEWP